MATIVTGEQYMMIDGKLHEIKRQLRQKGGYPHDPEQLSRALQAIVEGRFDAVEGVLENIFIAPVSDKDLAEELREVAAKWRRLASELGYAGPIAWKVKAGFTLKQHAPKAGPCYKNFAYLQDWGLRDDEPTNDGIVFWIPRLLPGSTAKTTDEQKSLLAELRQRYDLPAVHLTNFGSAALLAGLILAHFKLTGERVPLDRYWVRTDTLDAAGCRMSVGSFGADGLNCVGCSWDDDAGGGIGCFPHGGVMVLGT